MIIKSLLTEISKYYETIPLLDLNNNLLKKHIDWRKAFSDYSITVNNYNMNLFGNYYLKQIHLSEKILETKIDQPVDYLFFIVQNFIAHSLPNHLAYVKISCLNSLDLTAPFTDVYGKKIYLVFENQVPNNYEEDIKKIWNILPNSKEASRYYITVLNTVENSVNSNHIIGAISIVLDNVDRAVTVIDNLSKKIDKMCEITAIGSLPKLDLFYQKLQEKHILISDLQKIKIPVNNDSIEVREYDTILYGLIKKSLS